MVTPDFSYGNLSDMCGVAAQRILFLIVALGLVLPAYGAAGAPGRRIFQRISTPPNLSSNTTSGESRAKAQTDAWQAI
jgi:hypothetical protein